MIKTEEGELFFSTAQKIFKLYEKVIPDEISSGHDFFARFMDENMVLDRISTPMYKSLKKMMSDEDFRWREKRGN